MIQKETKKLFPTIGIQESQSIINFNFGLVPFDFDIEAYWIRIE